VNVIEIGTVFAYHIFNA